MLKFAFESKNKYNEDSLVIGIMYERRPESKDTSLITGNLFFKRWHYCNLWRDVTNKSRLKPVQYVEISARERFSRWKTDSGIPPHLLLIIQSKKCDPFSRPKRSCSHWNPSSTCPGIRTRRYEPSNGYGSFEKKGLVFMMRGTAGRLWWQTKSSKKSNNSSVNIVVWLITNFSKSVQVFLDLSFTNWSRINFPTGYYKRTSNISRTHGRRSWRGWNTIPAKKTSFLIIKSAWNLMVIMSKNNEYIP